MSNKERLEKAFTPDFNDELFTIEIVVYKNGTTRQINFSKSNYKPTYHEAIGAIEVIKSAFLREISEVVKDAYSKHTEDNK